MMMEVDVLTQIKQALVKENMVGDVRLIKISDDFYEVGSKYVKDRPEAHVIFTKVKRSRMAKMCRFASARIPVDTVENLSPEELELYCKLYDCIDLFWRTT